MNPILTQGLTNGLADERELLVTSHLRDKFGLSLVIYLA
jgi:hypothetical protein